MELQSEEIAIEYEVEHQGDPTLVTGVASLEHATKNDLTYATSYDDPKTIKKTDAGILIVPPSLTHKRKRCATLIANNPRLLYCKVTEEFVDSKEIHRSATIEDGAIIGDNCSIGANVYIADYVTIGDNCVIQPGAIIGGDGLYFMRDHKGKLRKHHQVGEIHIGDNVEIGSNTCIDRAMFDETIIESGSKLDNFVHVAHDVHIGQDCYIPVGCVFGGHVVLENKVRMQPAAAIASYSTIHEGAEVGMNSTVLGDVEEYKLVVGSPAEVVGESSVHK
ncbi:LpxD N-terminal domain-containing protein [Halorubrum salinum]|uniref:LpxD N-terminal domain-containing protein n=1 Tax=Halorubrum salinum TaxID=767517 RepID=UPI0021136075|nr:LpxD N-terminal domain-containing protein [Halorubrum salinum]